MELPSKIKQKHFLVCDDYESMRTMVCDSLKNLGVTKITTAKSGNEGFKMIEALLTAGTPIEFVMTDLMMEDGSGVELTRMIRASEKAKNLPILMVTSKSEVGFVLESIKAGVDSYVVKPWTLEDLHKKLVEVDGKRG